jgi:ribosomal protein S11
MSNPLVKKAHFFFTKKGIGILILEKKHSNIFLTFTDLRDKVVICKTSGSSFAGFSKKKKKSPQALEKIISCLMPYFVLYNIKYVKLYLTSRVTVHVYTLVRELSMKGVNIFSFHDRKNIPHNGMRGRKMRRV